MIAQFAANSRSLNAHHPEWWVGGLSALAWCMLFLGGWPGAEHAHHGAAQGYLARFAHWMLMVVAMMLPLILESARISAVRSFWKRRHRAICIFLAGYLAVWALLGIPVALLPPSPLLAATSLGLAGAWFLARLKVRLRRGCHLTIPIAPHGWRADRSCAEFGWKIGAKCAGNCGLLMLACAALDHALAVMALIAALTWLERSRPLNTQWVAAILMLSGAAVAFSLLAR